MKNKAEKICSLQITEAKQHQQSKQAHETKPSPQNLSTNKQSHIPAELLLVRVSFFWFRASSYQYHTQKLEFPVARTKP